MIYKCYQHWGKYRGAAGSMIRFYLPRSDVTDMDGMSPASLKAWTACDRAFRQMTETEREIVRCYYAEAWEKERQVADPMKRVADVYSQEMSEIKRIIDRAIRLVVVYRGLADE